MAIDAARIIPFGPQLPAVKEGDPSLITALRSELDEIRRSLDTVAANATDGATSDPTIHSNLSGLDYTSSGHTGFASEAEFNAHVNDPEIHDRDLDYVLRNPVTFADQTVTQNGSYALEIINDDNNLPHLWRPSLKVRGAALVISNLYDDAGWAAGDPATPLGDDGSQFWLYSKRITGGAGGWTLNVISSAGTVTRLDLPVVVRQSATPPTTGGHLLWIDTTTTPHKLKWLGDGGSGVSWQDGFTAV